MFPKSQKLNKTQNPNRNIPKTQKIKRTQPFKFPKIQHSEIPRNLKFQNSQNHKHIIAQIPHSHIQSIRKIQIPQFKIAQNQKSKTKTNPQNISRPPLPPSIKRRTQKHINFSCVAATISKFYISRQYAQFRASVDERNHLH